MRAARPALALSLTIALVLAVVAGSPAATPKPVVTVTLAVKAVGATGKVVATGKVTPAPKGGRVELQLRRNGTWAKLASGKLSKGHFQITAHPRGDDRFTLRAAVFVGKRQLGASPSRTVKVLDRSPSPSSAGAPAAGGPPAGSSVGPTPPAPPGPPDFAALSAPSLMATIESYSSLPAHLSATPNSTSAEDEFQANLAAAGLTLGEQAFEFPRFAIGQVGLSVDGTTVPRAAIAPLLYSGSTPDGGVTAELFDGGEKEGQFTTGDVKGKIVVVRTPFEHNSKAVGLYPAIEKAVKGEAAGFVSVGQKVVGDYPKWEDVNARNGSGKMPVLMVGKRSGAAVLAAAEAGGKDGTLTLVADTSGKSCDRDVWGELEGADPSRRVFIGTPASSFTPSATEHGSGVAITVGLARYYASLPKSQRPETLVFMALGGHEIGWLGLQALLASPKGPWFQEADAYVHLGSALGAPVAEEQPDGTIVTTPKPDPTGRLHDSENPLLEHSIIEDFEAAGVPTPETPPHTASGGEQTNAYAAGIPTVSFSGASLYFHSAGDLPSTVDPTILAQDADAFRRSVDTITAIPPGLLKAENAHAAQLGSEIDAASRAPVNPTLGAGGKTLGSGGVGGPAATPVASCP